MAVRPSEVTKKSSGFLEDREWGDASKGDMSQREIEGGKESEARGEKYLYEVLEGG